MDILMSNTRADARSEFRSGVSKALAMFDLYGLGVHMPGAITRIIALSEKLHRALKAAEKEEGRTGNDSCQDAEAIRG